MKIHLPKNSAQTGGKLFVEVPESDCRHTADECNGIFKPKKSNTIFDMPKWVWYLILFLACLAKGISALGATTYYLDVPMYTSIQTFSDKLVSTKGYKVTSKSASVWTFSGTYQGVNNCKINVHIDEDSGLVDCVLASFPKRTTWASLKKEYNQVVSRFRNNGKYAMVDEMKQFNTPYYDGCSNELQAVRNSDCMYMALLDSRDNIVLIGINNDQTVGVLYLDRDRIDEARFSENDQRQQLSSGSVPGYAAGEQFTFLDIPISGNYRDFAQRLINERSFRFHHETPEQKSITLLGFIDGMDNCEVHIFAKSDTENVFCLNVYLPERFTWDELLYEYQEYCRHFRNLYPVISSSSKFDIPCTGYELDAVAEGHCKFVATFQAPGGTIRVKISAYRELLLDFTCK